MRRLEHAPVCRNEMNMHAPEIGAVMLRQCTPVPAACPNSTKQVSNDIAPESLLRYLTGHRGEVLQRMQARLSCCPRDATNQDADAIPLMGHVALRAYLASHWRSARNYTRRRWRVVAQCVNNLHILIKGACSLHISSKEMSTTTVLFRRNVYYPLISHPQVLP
jgi:hypothetical protein